MKIFRDVKYDVLSLERFRLFSDLENVRLPDRESEQGKKLVSLAEEALETEIPQLYASVYRRFLLDGNRLEYETAYFRRRQLLKQLMIGEIIENNGRFTDKLIDVLWLILEESSWVLPAHNYGRDYSEIALPETFDESVTWVDLFSAETAAMLAFVYHYLKDKLNQAVPDIITDRIKYLVDRRVVKPFLRFNNMGWMGFLGNAPNNWNPWIISNVLCATALVIEDISVRKRVLQKAFTCLDFFVDHYPADGGCDEGPGYWGEAGASLFDCLEIIYDFTGGKADYFANPLLYKMLDYIRKVHLQDHYFAAFADSPVMLFQDGMPTVVRMGIRTNNEALTQFGMSLTNDNEVTLDSFGGRVSQCYRNIKNLCFQLPKQKSFVPKAFDVLPDLQLAVIRNEKFVLAAKGGNNNESHNHNDIGNFILFADKKPLVIDLGAPTYTKDVFTPAVRYSVFPINSFWHNLPVINGNLQKEGAQYQADSFSATENKIKIEYQSAYEACAKVQKCVRELEVSEQEMLIRETVVSEGADVRFQYYFCEKPSQDNNEFTFSGGTKLLCPENAECFLEKISVTDEKVISGWQTNTIWRLVVAGLQACEIKIY